MACPAPATAWTRASCAHAREPRSLSDCDLPLNFACIGVGENSRESSRNQPNARSDVKYEITFQKKREDKIYKSASLLQPKDRKQDGRDNDYVQQRHNMAQVGTAALSFERSAVPLSFNRTAEDKAGVKTKLRVHVKLAD